jgi:hypothetical protein
LQEIPVIRRPLLVSTAALSALVLCGASSSAGAASTTTKAAGTASSLLTVATASAGGHVLRLADVSLLADTLSGSPLSKIVITPLEADGTAIGKQVITPDSSGSAVPSQSSPGALSGLLSVTSPALTAAATNAPAAHVGAVSLGSLKVVGLSVPLEGTLDLGSSVSGTTGALGQKSVVLENLALPSIADLLAALGLDLSKLPVVTLNNLVKQLDLVNGAVSAAQAAAGAALGQVSQATQTVTSATSALSQATASATAATAGLTSATATLQGLLDGVPAATLLALPGADTVAGFLALSPVSQAVVAGVVPGLSAALADFNLAQATATATAVVVTTATSALAAAQAALASLTSLLTAALAPLQAALTAVLDDTPLVSLDSLSLSSKAAAKSNKAGGQEAEVLGGSISGLHVLGTDVLDNALGVTSLDLTELVGSATTALTGAISTVTSTLSSVLSTVPSLPTLKIPAPTVSVLTKSATTGVSGGFGRASNTVSGLSISLPAISLPTSIALPGAASLPALTGVTQTVNGLLKSAPITLDLLSMSEQAAFRPAVVTPGTSTPTGGTPPTTPVAELPTTGLPVGIAVLSLVLVGGSLVLRRRVVS